MMKRYNLINNTLGWLAFAIAAFSYCSTIESTASFWDCSEFITTANKMEVGHPPGAPFFMLLGNLFTQFASSQQTVAAMINTMSALLSAGCILFLFWTITHLARKLFCKGGVVETTGQMIAVMGAGMVGALAYAWSDTFWFSAVEGEVYAFSSFFTAVVFWLILKWENHADEPHSDRYLVLIAYLTGLSIGVHLLNLLCITAIVLVYYYKKKGDAAGAKGSLIAVCVSMALIAVVLYGLVPGIVKVAGWSELLFVNQLGCSFNTGVIVYIVVLVATMIWAVYESFAGRNKERTYASFILTLALLGVPFFGSGASSVVLGLLLLGALGWLLFGGMAERLAKKSEYNLMRVLNTTMLCFMMLTIGYSTYAVTVIRSSANPPMDQNSPEDIFTLGQYLNREQYGTKPLIYGPAYTSPIIYDNTGMPVTEEVMTWQRVEKKDASEPDRYEQILNKREYKYAVNMLFPRIFDSDHASSYPGWIGRNTSDFDTKFVNIGPQEIEVPVPTQLDNLKYFFNYQLNFMYFRYFMWNFAGRQNDIQSQGEAEHGNWISGISFLDNLRLGDQSQLPDDLKNNKGCNKFYMLPLLLGLIGIFWQLYRGRKGAQQFWVVGFLFFMTGIAIILYLNQTPGEPRERDYAYAGSFYAFTIWIGLAVTAITDWVGKLKNLKLSDTAKAGIVTAACLCVPIQMVTQTWDDHDRSGRYVCRDFGQNYLQSIDAKGNPIIFTNGDNDTFPLWYNQDVEGVRQDARVCNLSYLQTDWYIDQMVRPAYTSPSLPITWSRYDYVNGHNDVIRIRPELKAAILNLYRDSATVDLAKSQYGDDPFELKNVMEYWVRNPQREDLHCIPTDTLYLTVDKEAVKRSGMTIVGDSIPDRMAISLNGQRGLGKNSLMMLEMLANANWERPIYVAVTVGPSNCLSLGENFVQEGMAYRVTPFKFDIYREGYHIDVDKMYDNMMNKFKFGGIDQPGIYIDETVMRMCLTHRRMYAMLANKLQRNGDMKRAKEVVAFVDKAIPAYNVPYGDDMGGTSYLAQVWYAAGDKKKGDELMEQLLKHNEQYLNWYLYFSKDKPSFNTREINDMLREMNDGCAMAYTYQSTLTDRYYPRFLSMAKDAKELGVSLDAYVSSALQRVAWVDQMQQAGALGEDGEASE